MIKNILLNLNRESKLLILLLVGLLFYIIGITSVLIVILPLVLVIRMRFPTVINSVISRCIISVILLYSIIQVAATIQFFFFPDSKFSILAGIVTLITLILVKVFPKNQSQHDRSFLSSDDRRAFLAASIFSVPILVAATVKSGIFLASIGGIQGIDGINHFAFITEMSTMQHFTYSDNNYYPYGFHIATAFIQDGLGIVQGDLGWLAAAKLYFVQYALAGGGMLYVLYYFALSMYRKLTSKIPSQELKTGIALSVGIIITVLYLAGFVYHGFLSYFYVCTAIVVGILYLFDYFDTGANELGKKLSSVSLFLFAALGSSMSWPLWTPALLVIALLVSLHKLKFTRENLVSREVLVLFFVVILHFIPLYLQLKYSTGDSSQGINLTGGLRIIHTLVLLGGVAILTVALFQKSVSEGSKRLLQYIFVPLLFMLFILICMQDFQFAEARYYTIKSSLFIEILLIVLFIVTFATWIAPSVKKSRWSSLVTFPLLASMAVTFLIGMNQSPLQDARHVLRGISSEPKPAHFDNDVAELSKLGEEGKVKDSNAISMHVSDSGKLYTHMQIFYWVGMMEYGGNAQKKNLVDCSGRIYSNLFDQNFSDSAQRKLTKIIRNCAIRHKNNNEPYYIITDDQSQEDLDKLFGDVATIL